jgi:hypothetical protein
MQFLFPLSWHTGYRVKSNLVTRYVPEAVSRFSANSHTLHATMIANANVIGFFTSVSSLLVRPSHAQTDVKRRSPRCKFPGTRIGRAFRVGALGSLTRAYAVEPARRPRSADEFHDELRRALSLGLAADDAIVPD